MMPRAALLLIALIALCSLAGCAGREVPVLIPVVVGAVLCPEPSAPVLPSVSGGASFDTLDQFDVFMVRDDLLRGYIGALRRAIACYRAQMHAQ